MSDLMKQRIEKLRLMKESANRRSSLYSDITKISDKNASKSLSSLNRASAPGKKLQKLGFVMLWIPEPTGITVAVGAPMILAGRYLDKIYNGATLKDIGSNTKETMSSLHQFKNHMNSS
jgi:hypothetical protein|tara:strand:+ start:49 stop:405 length:357 start_codon:yes stop_codon:yes gene_type:complete